MKTKTLGLLIVAVVVVAAGVLVVLTRSGPGASPATSTSVSTHSIRQVAPADFKATDYAGKPLVVNFFGSWCEYCKLEANDLARFAKANPGAQVVGIASQDTEKDAKAFMAKYGMTYPLVVDDGSLTAKYAIQGFPTTIFFDAAGKETGRLVGASTFDQFNASLAQAQ